MFGIRINKKPIITLIAVLWCLFQLYTGFFGVLAPMQQRPIHLAFALILTFLIKPISKKLDTEKLYFDQIASIILTITFVVYMYMNAIALSLNTGKYSNFEIFISAVILLLVIESARRLTGIGLISIGAVFLIYSYFGKFMPSLIRHPGASVQKILVFNSLSTESIFGVCIDVSATFIFLFILYAKLLEVSGGGQVFIDLATSLVGQVRGGPAKVAVVGSGFFGSISGSAVANVVGTGTFTIPLMKRIGYRSEFAGAVEAVASSGGQFMPPIMGASSFLIAELLGIAYWKVAAYAAVPAILYYFAVFCMVDLEAGKYGLKGLSRSELPKTFEVLKKGWPSLISPVVLMYMLVGLQWSPAKSAVWAFAVAFVISMIYKETRMNKKQIISVFEEGAIGALETSVACAAVGIVVGSITLTGLALKLSSVLITVAGGNLAILLFVTMIACVIMGMGLPTVACYIVLAVMVAPALIKMNVLPIAAHLFIFYFGIISAITPPVALASFVAAGIAKANFVKTSLEALKLGLSAFILPFMFVFSPALILQGPVVDIVQSVITAIVGIYALSITLEGYFLTKTPLIQRIFFGIAALTMIIPETITDLIGVVIFIVMVVVHIAYNKKVVLKSQVESGIGGERWNTRI